MDRNVHDNTVTHRGGVDTPGVVLGQSTPTLVDRAREWRATITATVLGILAEASTWLTKVDGLIESAMAALEQ